jgi:hypothetical protein
MAFICIDPTGEPKNGREANQRDPKQIACRHNVTVDIVPRKAELYFKTKIQASASRPQPQDYCDELWDGCRLFCRKRIGMS